MGFFEDINLSQDQWDQITAPHHHDFWLPTNPQLNPQENTRPTVTSPVYVHPSGKPYDRAGCKDFDSIAYIVEPLDNPYYRWCKGYEQAKPPITRFDPLQEGFEQMPYVRPRDESGFLNWPQQETEKKISMETWVLIGIAVLLLVK